MEERSKSGVVSVEEAHEEMMLTNVEKVIHVLVLYCCTLLYSND